jgi:hypothetical protein
MKKMKTILILLLLVTVCIFVKAQTALEIEKANKSGHVVFLVVYNTSGTNTDKAITIVNETKKSFVSSAANIKMNTTDPANGDLVMKYRLSGVPLPVILVLNKNGNTAGGLLLKDATPEKLANLIPSPKFSEILDALAVGKSVFLVVYKESMISKKNVIENCYLACNKMDDKSVMIKVDSEDKNEVKLLSTVKHNLSATEPVTYVINSAGQITGTYNGITDLNNLISSATKVISGGCCPGGSKKSGCK